MALTSKYGFFYKKHLLPSNSVPATLEVILANSAALVLGQAVKYSSGFLAGAPASSGILGILVGLVDKNGQNIFKKSLLPKPAGTIVGDDTYTAAPNNQTIDQVKGVVIVDPMALFFCYSDGNIAQSDIGTFFNGKVNAATYIDGVTNTSKGAFSSGTQQFQLVQLVPTLDDGTSSTTAGLFRIGRSQFLNDITA